MQRVHSMSPMHTASNNHGAPAHNRQNTDAPSFDEDYRCHSIVFAARAWSFGSGNNGGVLLNDII